jgi:hypothetical protein
VALLPEDIEWLKTFGWEPPKPPSPGEAFLDVFNTPSLISYETKGVSADKRRRRNVALFAAGVAIGVTLASALLAEYQSVDQTRQEVARTQESELCSMYSAVIHGYRPESRPAGPERDRYEQAFSTIRAEHAKLGC